MRGCQLLENLVRMTCARTEALGPNPDWTQKKCRRSFRFRISAVGFPYKDRYGIPLTSSFCKFLSFSAVPQVDGTASGALRAWKCKVLA